MVGEPLLSVRVGPTQGTMAPPPRLTDLAAGGLVALPGRPFLLGLRLSECFQLRLAHSWHLVTELKEHRPSTLGPELLSLSSDKAVGSYQYYLGICFNLIHFNFARVTIRSGKTKKADLFGWQMDGS